MNTRSDFEEELEPFVGPDECATELQRAKSSSMHQNTRPNLLQFQQGPKTGLADQAHCNQVPNQHFKTMFMQLGVSDSLMIDEAQEINRKTSKDSKDTNGSQLEAVGPCTAPAEEHPDTPYPLLAFKQKPNSDLERV